MQETLKNLAKAFIGESQARNRYTIYASIATKEGYRQIAEIFLATADQEKEHAEWHMRMINELRKKAGQKAEDIIVEAPMPNVMSTTIENLKAAIHGENYEERGGERHNTSGTAITFPCAQRNCHERDIKP